MRGAFLSLPLALMAILLVAGCAKKETAQQPESSVDSLLASNPTEQTPGDITPQTEYQPPEQKEEPPAPAPRKTRTPPRQTATLPASQPTRSHAVTVAAGTGVKVTVNAKVSSATAQPGESWTGTVKEPVIVGERVVIPAGSTIHGVVAGVEPAQKGSRAFLVLAIRSVEIDGKSHALVADADSIIAGSTRARNLGAVAAGAGAGALLGKAIGGSSKGALIGGILGGAAATGAVAASKGYQVEIKEGTELTFTVNEPVVMK
ncbi:MAG TPA: hypothetical protein VGK93_01585 [Candidatus Eisenbacteria bacterium]|jgi:hypothetical protein